MEEKKRILLVGNTCWSMFNFRLGVARALRESGYEVIIAAPADHTTAMIRAEGFVFVDVLMDNKGVSPVNDFQLFLSFLKFYRKLRPDLIFHYTIKPNIYGGLASGFLHIPTISFVTGLGSMFINPGRLTKLIEMMYQTAFKFSKKVWFLNQDDFQFFTQKRIIPAHKAEVLPGEGVDTNSFFPVQPDQSSDQPGFKFLYLGRVLKDKGILELIAAARELKKIYPKAIVEILGYIDALNPSAIALEEVLQWEAEGIITYAGTASDVRPAIASADCIILPSYREGISRTLLEAASMSKPIIASNVTGCREVVEHEVTGYLCNPMDADDLLLKMKNMMELSDTERFKMGAAGRNKVIYEYDEELIINKYKQTVSATLA